MKRFLGALVLLIAIILIPTYAMAEVSASDFTVSVLDDTYCNIDKYIGVEAEVVIPSEIDGHIVKSISADAFKGNKTITKVVMPDTVVSIGNASFGSCSNLKEIKLSAGLGVINRDTFEYCTSLETVTIPEGVKQIHSYAFDGCNALKTVKLPDSIEVMAARAFNNCPALESVNYPKSLREIFSKNSTSSDYEFEFYTPFYGCSSLKSITIPEGVTNIPRYVFRNMSSLETVNFSSTVKTIDKLTFAGSGIKNVVLPDGVTSIGDSAFGNCYSLESVYLGEELTSIGIYAFSNCSKLAAIEIPAGVTLLGKYMFENCSSLAEVTLHDGLKAIHAYVFDDCTSLTSIKLPDTVEIMAACTFNNCKNLESVNYPKSLKEIYAVNSSSNNYEFEFYTPFYGCSSLKSITIPEGVTTIPKYVFRNMSSLETVNFSSTVKTIDKLTFAGSGIKNVVLPDGVTSIGDSAFGNCYSLESAYLGEDLTTIGEYAFNNCQALEEIEIPNGIKTIESNVFEYCYSLKSVKLPDSLNAIYTNAFKYCTALKEIIIPDSVTAISTDAFRNCTSLEDITLSKNWNTVYSTHNNFNGYLSEFSSPFTGCSALTEITIPEGVTVIPDDAFKNLSSLKNVNFSSTVKTIGEYTFSSSGIVNAVLPDSVTSIGESAFENCYSLKSVDLSDTLTNIGEAAFRNCQALEEIEIPNGIKTIESNVFEYCYLLKNVKLPDGLNAVHANSFKHCTALKEIVLPDSITIISSDAFKYCTSLEDVTLPKNWTHTYSIYNSNSSSLGNFNTPFLGCTSLKSITIPDGATVIPSYAFWDMENLETVFISDTVTKIGSYVFADSKIETLNLSENVKQVGDSAFSACYSLKSVSVPSMETTFGKNAFANSPNVTIYCYAASPAHYLAENNGYKYYLFDEHTHDYSVYVNKPATCTKDGWQTLTCTVCGYKFTEVIKTQGHSFGEWIVQKIPTTYSEGLNIRVCEPCGITETQVTEKINVDITENSDYGLVNFHVVDALTQESIPDVQILIAIGEDELLIKTDAYGIASYVLPVGKISASVYASGYLARNINFTVAPGEQDLPVIGISTQPLVDAQVTTREMTIEEILAAGIDPNDKANSHVFEYKIEFTFRPEIDVLSLVAFFNSFGQLVGFGPDYNDDGRPDPDPGLGDADEGEPQYRLHYHLSEVGCEWSHGWCKTVDVNKGDHVYLHYKPFRDDAEDFIFDAWYEDPGYTKKIAFADIENYTTTVYGRWIPKNQGDDDNKSLGKRISFKTKLSDETPVEIFPISETFYLVIYGEVKWLKEMYNVQLVAVNNSTTDTVEDCVASLELPFGLSLAAMTGEEQSFVQEIGTLNYAGQEGSTKTVNWFVKGDAEGYYDVTAKLTGKLMPFEEEFSYEYTAVDPIKVYAGSAMQMTIEAPGVTYYNDDYKVRITLQNVSDKPIYDLKHAITGVEQYKITTYSDGHEEKNPYMSQGFVGEHYTSIFNPGDKMIIDLTVNIMFESDLVQRQIDNLTGIVDGVESLLSAYDCFKKGANSITELDGYLSKVHKGIESVITDDNLTSEDLSKAYSTLSSVMTKLMAKIKKGDNKALDAYDKLKKTGVVDFMKDLSDNKKDYYDADIITDVLKIADSIKSIIEDMGEDDEESVEPEKPFNVYDSIRTLIQAVPVKFVLQNVVVTSLENSTTRIPYKVIRGNPDQVRYFGVENIGRTLYSLVIAAMGEIDVPFSLKILGFDDPSGYGDAVDYLKAVEKEIATVQAHSATGSTTFKAWIERAGAQTFSLGRSSSDFELSTNNETAYVDENGVLNFTGAGYINVKPKSSEGGILYIQMEEDGETKLQTYVIDVVEPHTCSSDKWTSVISPDETGVGYAVKMCDICDDIISIKDVPACTEHTYGSYIVNKPFSENGYGMRYKECQVCGNKDYVFITSDAKAKISFNADTMTANIEAESECDDAVVVFATYKNKKLVSFATAKKDLVIGENYVTPEEFSLTDADTVKIMVWKSLDNLTPICVAEESAIVAD